MDIVRPHVEWLYRDRAALGHNQELPEADRIDVSVDQVLEGRFIIGSPSECMEEIKRYQELGVEELVLRCQWPGMPNEDSLKAVELFGREVLHHLGKGQAGPPARLYEDMTVCSLTAGEALDEGAG